MKGPDGANGLHVKVRCDDDGRWALTDLYLHGAEITGEILRAIRLPQVEGRAYNAIERRGDAAEVTDGWEDELTIPKLRGSAPEPEPRTRKRKPLTRPTGADVDAFYRRVADAYSEHQRTTSTPAKKIAAEADVPVTTAHRWVREARRRGFLAPGRKGRVG